MEVISNGQLTRDGFYLVNLGGTVITASLAINVEGVSLLYVASSGVIQVVSIRHEQSLDAVCH